MASLEELLANMGPEDNLGVHPVAKPLPPEPRIAVIGPNGERGTVPLSTAGNPDAMPPGWAIRPPPAGSGTIGPGTGTEAPVRSFDVNVPGGPSNMDIFDQGLKKAHELPSGEVVYPPGLDKRGRNPLAAGYEEFTKSAVGAGGGGLAGSALKGAVQRPLMRRALEKAGKAVELPEALLADEGLKVAASNTARAATSAREAVAVEAAKAKEALADTLRAIEKRILTGRPGPTSTEMDIFETPVRAAESAATAAESRAAKVAAESARREQIVAKLQQAAQGMADESLSVGQAAKDVTPGLGVLGGGAVGHAVNPYFGTWVGANVGGRLGARLVGAPVRTAKGVVGRLAQSGSVPINQLETMVESPAFWYNLVRPAPYMGALGGYYAEEEE